MGNVFELRQSIALSGLKILLNLYPRATRPGLYPVSPSGFALKKEMFVYPFNSMTLPLLGRIKGGLFLFFHPHPTFPVEGVELIV